MGEVVIGVDPDADKHGVAIYKSGRLEYLEMLTGPDLIDMARRFSMMRLIHGERVAVLLSIEDVMSNQFVYSRNQKATKAAQCKVAMSIGRCQQAQVELMRWLDYHKIKYVLHKPQKGNWAKDKPSFERITRWKGRSNEDTRAAAFFGHLALR